MEQAKDDIEVLTDLNHDGKPERVIVGLAGYAESGYDLPLQGGPAYSTPETPITLQHDHMPH